MRSRRWPDYVDAVVHSLVDGAYVLVGYSLGGAVAMELGLRKPEGLAGLAFVATGARLRVNPALVRLYQSASAATGELPAMPAAAFEDGVDMALVEEAAEHRGLTPVETAANDWKACDAFDRMDTIRGIRVPTLIVGGSADMLAPPKFSEFLAAQIPRASFTSSTERDI